jgi:RhoGAP domain
VRYDRNSIAVRHFELGSLAKLLTGKHCYLDAGEEVTFFSQDYVDIFAVCDTVKTWLRSLPHPIFPERSYYEVIRVMRTS